MVYKIRDLSKKFGKHYALKNIDLDINENEKIRRNTVLFEENLKEMR